MMTESPTIAAASRRRSWLFSGGVAVFIALSVAPTLPAQTGADSASRADSARRAAADSSRKSPAAKTATPKTSPKARSTTGTSRTRSSTRSSSKAGAARPKQPARIAPTNPGWPVKTADPLPGSILPNRRIVAFYGNPLSKRMGILGEIPSDQMLERLDREVQKWAKADTTTPVLPALHLIATVAQGSAGADGMYRARMPDTLVERVYGWAKSRNALTFLDVQVGKSTVQAEVPRLEKFLSRPDVHLAIDPEFAMKRGGLPGKRIGTYDAEEVNWAIRFLADIVDRYHLPPKVLVVHRFTRPMLTNYKEIKLDPRVQVVIDMDGWGPPHLKVDSYQAYVYSEPVQFTGFKLFFHNDTRGGGSMMTPAQVLALFPRPLYIQYQ